jgi:hypothetical protein
MGSRDPGFQSPPKSGRDARPSRKRSQAGLSCWNGMGCGRDLCRSHCRTHVRIRYCRRASCRAGTADVVDTLRNARSWKTSYPRNSRTELLANRRSTSGVIGLAERLQRTQPLTPPSQPHGGTKWFGKPSPDRSSVGAFSSWRARRSALRPSRVCRCAE